MINIEGDDMNDNLNSKTVLVTGANRGIGLELCKIYLNKGNEVFAVCRQTSQSLSSSGAKVIDNVDVSTTQGIAALKMQIADNQIDLLINNAGILRSQSFDNLNYEQIREQFEVNTLGPIRVVEALFDNLISGSKVAMITSRMGSIDDNSSGGSYGYRMSKCALNAAGKSMAIDFKEKGIAVALLHPGYVQTEMVNFGGDISAEVSAERLAQRIDELNLENSGSFWHSNGELLPW